MNVLICIATGQSLANLIPVLQLKPMQVIVLASQSFKNKAKEFRDLLHDLGATASVRLVDGCPDTGIAEISQFIEQKLIPLLPEGACDVNLTGGTKLHSFALYEKLRHRAYQDNFFYVDTANRLIEYYPQAQQSSYHEALASILDIDLSLKGMGKLFVKAESDTQMWQDNVQQRAKLTHWIAHNVVELQQVLGELNAIATFYDGGKKNQLQATTQSLHQYPKEKAIELLEKAHDLKLLKWQGGKNVQFDHYSQSRYLTGAWIEEYVWLVAQALQFEQVKSSVTFGNMGSAIEKNRATNEIDLLVCHANAMLAVECKSAVGAKNLEKSQDMFHKLSGVANRAGGLMCSKLFVSAFSLKQKDGRDIASVYHAKEQNIKIVQAEELIQLPEILTKWRDKGRI